MARIGTAYIEVQGDFSKIRRELAALAREGDIKIKADLDASAATAEKKELGKDEKFSLEGAFNRSSLAGLKATKQTFAKDETFHLHGAVDLASVARAKAAKETLGGEEEFKVRADLDIASFAKAIVAEAGLRTATTATVRESGALADIFNRSSLSIGQMASALVFASPLILDMAGALGALVGSLGAATAGFGALAVGAASAATVGFGGILAIAAPAISSLTDLMGAQEAANKAQVTGAKTSGLAAMASAQQIRSANEQVETSLRGVETAEEQLELAQESELLAQEALTQAREDATRQLQDMRRAAIEGDTAEERARLTLKQANENLNQLLMSGTATALDLADADLSIVEARQNLRDVTIDSNRAQQDYNKANRGGISEMPGVVSAQQSLDSAVRGVEEAQQGVADAHRDVAKALQNLSYQQKRANQATVAGGTSMAALALAQKKAGPVVVEFAKRLKELGRNWRGLTREGRDDFFRMLTDGVDRLNEKLPLLARSANRSMRALRRGFNDFLDSATGPEFNRFIHVMTNVFAKSIGPVSRAFGNIAKVLQRIAVAVAPDIVRMVRGFEEMTKGWLDSTKNARKLRGTIHGLVKQTEAWWDLLVAAGQLVTAVLVPGMGQGKQAVKGITDQLKEWTAWVNAHPEEMRDFFKEGLETTKLLAEALLSFMPHLVVFAQAMRPIATAFLTVTKALNSISVGNISALTVLLGLFVTARLIRSVKGVSDALGGILSRSGRLHGALHRAFLVVGTAAQSAAAAASEFVGSLAAGIRLKAGKIRTAIGNAMRAGRTFITSAATSAAEWAGSLVTNIRSSRLSKRLGTIFRAIALRLGKIMAGAVAAAVVVGEGIGGAAASLSGLMRERLGPKMSKVGKFLGRKFGVGFVAGFVLALPFLAKELRKHLPGQGGDSDLGGALWKDSPFSVDLPGSWWAKGGLVPPPQYLRRGGAAMRARGTDTIPAMLTPGEFVFRREAVKRIGAKPLAAMNKGKGDQRLIAIMRKVVQAITKALRGIAPQGFQRGGVVGRRGVRPGPRDKIPALLEVGELVIPKKMVDQTKKNAKAIATDMGGEIGKGYKKVSEDSKDFVKRHGKSMETLRKTAGEQTDKFRKTTGRDFEKTGKDATDRTKRMRGNVVDGFAKMRASSIDQSGRMKSGVGEDFRNMTGAVGDGLRRIAQMTNNALKALGVKRVNFRISEERGGRGQRRQTGGMVVPGTGTGDKVPATLPIGTGIVNRKAADVLLEPRELAFPPDAVRRIGGPRVIDRINREFPRFQLGGVIDRTGVPHFARGGWVGDSPSGLNPAVKSIALWAMQKYGASASDTVAPRSGSSFHPSGGAVDLVNSDMLRMARGLVGAFQPKLEELIYTPLGFSISGGQRVPAFAQADHYDHVHIAALGKAVAAVARQIKRVLLKGADGPLKDMGQAALDKVRGAANKYIAAHAPSGGDMAGGITGDGDVERIFARAAKQLSTSRTATLALGEAGYAESGMRDLAYGDSTSRGALQLLASTAAGMNINPHDEGAIASAFLLRGFYGRGGANKLAAQGLPAHLVAQNVQGSAFASGSNYAAQKASATGWMRRFGLQLGGIVAPFVGSFARGGEVKQDGLGALHKGEQVLPKPPAGGLGVARILLELKRALRDGGEDLKTFLRKFSGTLDQMEKRRLKEFLRRLDKWGGPAAEKLTVMVRRELHERPGHQRDQRPSPDRHFSEEGFMRRPQIRLGQLRRQRQDLREELRDVVQRDDLPRKRMQRLVESINAQIEATKENTEQNRELRRSIKEHNDLYGDVKSSTATAVRGLSNFVASEVGHHGHQKTRNAGWGVDRRY